MDLSAIKRAHTMLNSKQPPKVATKPKSRTVVLRPPISNENDATGSVNVSQLRSKLFGSTTPTSSTPPPSSSSPTTNSSFHTLPRQPIKKAENPPPPPPRSPDLEEEYDDIASIRASIQKSSSFHSLSVCSTAPASTDTPPRPSTHIPASSPNKAPALPPPNSPRPCKDNLLTDAIPLVDFVRNSQNQLPVKIRVYTGFNGASEKSTIREGELLNLHFMKSSQSVNVLAGENGQMVVPINSGIEFGVIYNIEGDYRKAYQGYQFETVSQMMSMSFLPKVVCTKSSYSTSSHESSVEANDILIVQDIVTMHQVRYLSCLKVQTNETKLLPESCSCCFSTSPYEVTLLLHQIVEHLQLPLECLVSYRNPDPPNVHNRLPKALVKLQAITTEKSVVVSRPSSVSTAASLLSIPVRLGVEVQQIQSSSFEQKKLVEATKTLFQNFDPRKLHNVTELSGKGGEGLDVLCEVICQSNPSVGIEILKPHSLPDTIYQHKIELSIDDNNSVDENEYDIPDVALATYRANLAQKSPVASGFYDSPKPSTITLTSQTDSVLYDVPPSRPGNTAYPRRNSAGSSCKTSSDKGVDALKAEVAELKRTMESIQKQTSKCSIVLEVFMITTDPFHSGQLQATVKLLERKLLEGGSNQSPGAPSIQRMQDMQNDPVKNKEYLASLTCEQVRIAERKFNNN